MGTSSTRPRLSLAERALRSPVGRGLARQVGLADPPKLRRGRQRPEGPVGLAVLAAGSPGEPRDDSGTVAAALDELGIETTEPLRDVPEQQAKSAEGKVVPPSYHAKLGALVIDATRVRTIAGLEEARAVLRPAMKGIERSGRLILVGMAPGAVEGLEARAAAQALDGLARTIAKELRGGATANLVLLEADARASDLAPSLDFLLDGRSAFVDGQVWTVGHAKDGGMPEAADGTPFGGRIVVVTGAARGIGAEIARVFARDGAHVVCVDIPQAGDALSKVANEIRGSALQLDITVDSAGQRIAGHVAQRHGAEARIWAIVHNAGITRDKLAANLDADRWTSVLDVNLAAQIRINETLLAADLPGGLADNGRIVGVASTSGIAGNKGQANYAASKAGVIGLVRAMSEELADRPVVVNAVAPGFIETEMTAKIPLAQRELFRRVNSLSQGGRPVDVAETIAWLADPRNGGVDGQVVRVCGQNMVGA